MTHNLHPKRLRRILIDAGIITETDLPDFEVLFSAVEAQEILEQASGSVAFSAAQKRLGMTRSQMDALIRAGILKPGEGGEKARPRFTEATIQHWLAFFTSFPLSPKWESRIGIAEAARKNGSSTDRVFSLILDHSLTLVYSVQGVKYFKNGMPRSCCSYAVFLYLIENMDNYEIEVRNYEISKFKTCKCMKLLINTFKLELIPDEITASDNQGFSGFDKGAFQRGIRSRTTDNETRGRCACP